MGAGWRAGWTEGGNLKPASGGTGEDCRAWVGGDNHRLGQHAAVSGETEGRRGGVGDWDDQDSRRRTCRVAQTLSVPSLRSTSSQRSAPPGQAVGGFGASRTARQQDSRLVAGGLVSKRSGRPVEGSIAPLRPLRAHPRPRPPPLRRSLRGRALGRRVAPCRSVSGERDPLTTQNGAGTDPKDSRLQGQPGDSPPAPARPPCGAPAGEGLAGRGVAVSMQRG